MDRVRFGRALGYGARHAAKSLSKAAAAAAAPNPRPPVRADAAAKAHEQGAGSFDAQVSGSPAGRPPNRGAGERLSQARAGVRQTRAQAGQLRRTVWSPLAKFTGVVGLQVSGTFFAVMAAFLSQGLWRDREAVHLGLSSPVADKLYLHAFAFVLFAYFAVSNFVRAHRKQRR